MRYMDINGQTHEESASNVKVEYRSARVKDNIALGRC